MPVELTSKRSTDGAKRNLGLSSRSIIPVFRFAACGYLLIYTM